MTYGEFIGWATYVLRIDIGPVECAYPMLTDTPLDGWRCAEDVGMDEARLVMGEVVADHPTWYVDALSFIERAQ
jgi:hypothetical protein